jgi:hypothetical protein
MADKEAVYTQLRRYACYASGIAAVRGRYPQNFASLAACRP